VGEHVFLKVKANRNYQILGSFPKLSAIYCGTLEILEKIESISYMLALFASMRVHIVFYVSLLNRYVPNPNNIIDWIVIQLEHKEYL
jgi:hypothetical protein